MSEYPPPPPPPYQPGPYDQPPAQSGGSGLAIATLVVGILALVLCWTVLGGIVLGLVALVLGIVTLVRVKNGTARGRGMAIAGLVVGIVGAIISIVLIVASVSILNSDSGKTYRQCIQNANGDQAKVQKCAQEFQRNLQN